MARPIIASKIQRLRLSFLFSLIVCLAGVAVARPPLFKGKAAPPDPKSVDPNPLRGPAAAPPNVPFPFPPELEGVDLNKQTEGDVLAKSANCKTCHTTSHDPHYKDTVRLGCVDCHGGKIEVSARDFPKGFPMRKPFSSRTCPAAPQNMNPRVWHNSANPIRSYTVLNHEKPEFIRFVNPGDHRISHISCGTTNCHPKIVQQSRKSMMTHSCMLWGAALYNNGSVPFKVPRYGEFYSMHGVPLRAQTVPPPSEFEMSRGVIPFLDPLPRFEITQPGNILRIFERGGEVRPEIGIPTSVPVFGVKAEDPGRPFLTRLSNRGLGTENRTDPVFIGLQKTRLFDPTLNFIGTNEQPGDYRQSGCSACHVIYANDRSPISAGPYAQYGNRGMASDKPEDDPDPLIPKNEPGHPIAHRFAKGNSIPTSQCMICHVHPGTTVMNSYLGYMWWDLETEGELMYPAKHEKLSAEEYVRRQMADPEETATRGLWGEPEFLTNLIDLNVKTRHTQFADFHSHGWVFSAVFRHDRKGNMLDYNGKIVEPTPELLQKGVAMPVTLREQYRDDAASKKTRKERDDWEKKTRDGIPMHLADLHVEKGMHCVDCHFVQDCHGNTKLQMEVRAGIEILCVDCHGSATKRATLRTSGPASYTSNPDATEPTDPKFGRDLTALRTPSGKPRFERRGDKIYQNSMVEPNLTWEVVQTMDTINPTSEHYNAKSAIAKTIHREGDQLAWGTIPKTEAGDDSGCAHSNKNMTCMACHSSWNPTCYGCHLPQRANFKMPQLHNEGDVTKNYTSYNWQTLRSDIFMLAKDGNVTGNKINPSRSSCAVHVGSYNGNRESIYYQQQTISGEGFSGIAFSTNVPHTFSGKNTTKTCTDCHLSTKDDNNAVMAQLLMQGTNYVNFIGRYCWVAAKDHGAFAVVATEREEPQAVIGSTLHKLAYPEEYEKHVKNGYYLKHAHEHPGKDISDNVRYPHRKTEVLSLQHRGEYLYAACGEGGLKVIDISMTDHKGFSERIFSAPVSPIGQRFYVNTKYATAVAAPTTIAPDPTRVHYKENHEGRVSLLYAFLYVVDKYEGLILVGAGTLLDGNPLNNFLKRELTFNPQGVLCGANAITIVGNYAYITCDAGLVVVDLSNPKEPKVSSIIDGKYLKKPVAVACQFRYAYVADEHGVKVFDITDLAKPQPVSKIEVHHVHNIYLGRTYAYLAAGKQGLVILDIENPALPKIDQIFNANGCINDLHDVKLGATYTSQFAYLADGKNGMRIVQLTNPDTPGNAGFSTRPAPELIATYKIPQHGHAVAIAKGVDRDRAVDESGNQLAVFGRLGARPFNLEEQRKLYMKDGKIWKVSDDPNWDGYKLLRP